MMRNDGQLGHKVGPKLATLMAKGVIAARSDLYPLEHKLRVKSGQELIDRAGREIAQLFAPHAAMVLADPGLPPEVRALLEAAASGERQWQAIAGFALSQSGASASLGELIGNDLAPTIRGLIARAPGQIPDAADIATMIARGIIGEPGGRRNIAEDGFDDYWATALINLSETIPPPDQVFELHNRGLIPEGMVHDLLTRFGLPTSLVQFVAALATQLLAPADAALAVLRGNMPHGEGVAVARANGVSATDFEIMIGNTGEPLALEALLEARRRGFIDDARLDRGIRQSRTRNEWIDVAHKLEYSPMSTADAIQAWVQGHLSEAESRQKARENGLEAADWDTLSKTAGESLSRTEMEDLYNRGEVTRADVEQALRESRLKPKYTADALKLHVKLLPERTVVSALSKGVISKAKAARMLADLGLAPDVITVLVAEATAVKLGPHHAITVGEIRQLYTEQMIDAAKTSAALAHLGFDAHDAAQLVALWDHLAAAADVRQAVALIRSRYVDRHLERRQAALDLDAIGVPGAARDRHLKLWDLERAATIRSLSEAQVIAAMKHQLISADDARGRLEAMGYPPADASILMGVAP